jgi:hypothetical protein
MRPIIRLLTALIVLAVPFSVALADAQADLSIRTHENDERYKIFKLVNRGTTAIKATVQLTKRCSGVSNNKKPRKTDYWVNPNTEIELGRAWSQSTCTRDYRVVKAEYI